jgi:hypothetical protein
MRTVHLQRIRSTESEESGCESDSSTASGQKKVHFVGSVNETDFEHSGKDLKECKKKSKLNRFNSLKIDRGDIPNGSELFCQILKEIQAESGDDEIQTPRSDSVSKPLRSILKHKS